MPTFSNLLQEISTFQQFPVEIEFIDDWLKRHNFQDEINFIPVDINPSKATAYAKRRSDIAPPYTEKPWIYDVIYSKHLNECWCRFLCCKELMHLFDKHDERVHNAKDVGQLIGDIVATDLGSIAKLDNKLSKATTADLNAYTKALVTLAPLHIIEELRPAYDNGTKSDHQIALFLKIPEVFIDRIFGEDHATLYTAYKNELTLLSSPKSNA